MNAARLYALYKGCLLYTSLPPVGKLVKCFVRPVVLQRQLQPGRLTLEAYLRCTVFYQSEAEKDLCQTEQKLSLIHI